MNSSRPSGSSHSPSQFRFLDHTADLAMECFGKDLSELLTNGAKGMFHAIVEGTLPGRQAEKHIEVTGDSPDILFLSWLRELLFIYDTERFIPTNFQLRVACGNVSCRGRPPGRPSIGADEAVRPYSEHSSPKEAANGYKASALLSGQTVSDEVILPSPIKAVTYHGLKVEHDASGIWRAEVLFDV